VKTIICLPTYNEKENIQSIIRAIFKEQDNTPFQLNILVIDDNSPDGTAQLVEKMQRDYPEHLYLITGEKEGLGTAYKWRWMQIFPMILKISPECWNP
jgi:dolichol-phosphate mannosyltransferase